MHLSTQKLIEQIHKSPLYGYFIETGGPCIAAELMKVSGASKTIHGVTIPYSKELSNKYKGFSRTVSLDYVNSVFDDIDMELDNKHFPLCYISSFQLDGNTHGYVGIRRHDNYEYYHLSIHDNSLTRPEKIDLLNETCIKLLHGQVVRDCCVDGVWTDHINDPCAFSPSLDRTLQFISQSSLFDNLAYIDTGEVFRLEDLLRKAHGKNLIIMKGSFNPVHKGHLEIIEQAQKQYPHSTVCFSISTHNFDKGEVDIKNLEHRIEMINKLGYGVLVYNRPLFEDLVKVLKQKAKEFPIQDVVFPMGGDTWTRFRACYDDDQQIAELRSQFVVFARGKRLEHPYIANVHFRNDFNLNISSTEIRKNPKDHLNDVPKEIQSCL